MTILNDMEASGRKENGTPTKEQFFVHLMEITRLALKQSSVPDLFYLLANHMHKLLQSDMCYITFWDEENQQTIPVAASGEIGKTYADFGGLSDELTMTESVLKAGKPIAVADVFNTPYMSLHIANSFPTKSLLALPLIADGEKLGAVLISYNKTHEFSEAEVEYGTIAANQIALIVQKTKLLDELYSNREELLKANAEKDKLLSIMAHDLRSPFTALLALTRLITDETADLSVEEVRSHAKSIDKSARNLYKLLENLLEWSQIQGGRVKVNFEAIFLDKIVDASIKAQYGGAKHKGIKIKTDIPKQLLVKADHRMMNSLLGNLLSNALKFTPAGGTITVKASRQSNRKVLVEVSDSGIGMDKETLKNLFRFNLDKQALKGTEGEPSYGIGLILCKEFIDQHGEKIWAKSTPGKGSSFYFTLSAATGDDI